MKPVWHIVLIVVMGMNVTLSLDPDLFAADGAGDALGLLDRALAEANLLGDDRLFLEHDFIFAHRDPEGLTLANRAG